ncbi:Uncharacterized protein DAT39_005689 [Clarias magur]|uniref:Uncharacterized protein n=1 Tax=Clarias magur TaxID=1594786 RepID=A0A8J4U2I6_CLAMG|nr:Uncharacterized protein DAT39_005689 [Clarias magur]
MLFCPNSSHLPCGQDHLRPTLSLYSHHSCPPSCPSTAPPADKALHTVGMW